MAQNTTAVKNDERAYTSASTALYQNESEKVFYDAEPFFAFSNSAGNNLFVIVKATGAGLNKEWAIEKISIE